MELPAFRSITTRGRNTIFFWLKHLNLTFRHTCCTKHTWFYLKKREREGETGRWGRGRVRLLEGKLWSRRRGKGEEGDHLNRGILES